MAVGHTTAMQQTHKIRLQELLLHMVDEIEDKCPRNFAKLCVLVGQTGLAGFEPTNPGVKVLCLTAWRQPYMHRILKGAPYFRIAGPLRFQISHSTDFPGCQQEEDSFVFTVCSA